MKNRNKLVGYDVFDTLNYLDQFSVRFFFICSKSR